MSKKNDLHINLNLNVRSLAPSATLAINEKSTELLQKGKEVYRFGLGQSPFPVPNSIVQELKSNAHQKDYLPVKGLKTLREAVVEFNQYTQGIDCSADDIIVGPGSKELIFILQLVYYGDLIIPTPSWVSYSPQAKIIGRNVDWVPTFAKNNWRLSPEQLEEICKDDPERPRIVILNYPSNPTGYTYPIERLKLLAKVARKYHVILISDEIYGLLHYQGQHVSIARFYPEGTIISNGMSKWCGAGGWRLGTFTFPSNLRWLQNAMAVVPSETFTSTSAPIQYAAIKAFRKNYELDEYLMHVRRILKAISKYMVLKLKTMNIEIPVPQGAFYLFPDFKFYKEKLLSKGINTSTELCNKLLDETGIAILPGVDFGRQPDELTARFAFVDFDGKKTLSAAKNNFKNDLHYHDFVEQHCPKIKIGMERLGNWLNRL